MGFFGKLRKKSCVPFHFEIHDDEFLVETTSVLDKGKVFDMFFKGVKRLRKKSEFDSWEELPDSFKASPQQLKSVAPVVVNKHFLEDIAKQVRLDIPSFKIINSSLKEVSFNSINPKQYNQKIVIKGVCFYEE
jgi:hypothetical protein